MSSSDDPQAGADCEPKPRDGSGVLPEEISFILLDLQLENVRSSLVNAARVLTLFGQRLISTMRGEIDPLASRVKEASELVRVLRSDLAKFSEKVLRDDSALEDGIVWVDFDDLLDGKTETLRRFVPTGVDVSIGASVSVGDRDGNRAQARVVPNADDDSRFLWLDVDLASFTPAGASSDADNASRTHSSASADRGSSSARLGADADPPMGDT